MKTLSEYIISINEAWADYKHYDSELEDILAKYEKQKNAKARSRYGWSRTNPHQRAVLTLAKYPMQILINKAGYKPSEIKVGRDRGSKSGYFTEINKESYGVWLEEQIESGKIKKEDLIKWWKEYDEEVAKANWHDVNYIANQIDPAKCWNPYKPKDDSVLKSFVNNPGNIIYYLKRHFLREEREDLISFLTDPVNQDNLKKALKKVEKKILKARPSFAQGTVENIKELISHCDYSGGDLEKMLKNEYRSSHGRTYYQGSNDYEGCEGSAIVSLILQVINKLYGFEVWHSMSESDTDEYSDREIKQTASIKGEVSDETLSGFLDDVDHLKFIVKDLGPSKKGTDHSSVWSSSFHTFYNHDFEVICKKDDQEIFHQTFTDVTIGSTFYSGGWD